MSEINAGEILKPFRAEIDRLDQDIVDLIAQRFQVVRQVGETKAKYGFSPIQPQRMEEVLNKVAALATEKGLNPEFVRNLYSLMIEHAHSLEFDITGPDDE